MEWKPIKTAPKVQPDDEGLEILGSIELSPGCRIVRVLSWDGDGWREVGEPSHEYLKTDITHWMPVPEPPKELLDCRP